MVEEFDVGVKTFFNRVYAIIALVFWIVAGIFVLDKLLPQKFGVVVGILIGVVRLFIIRNKYSWEIATLNEINSIKTMLRNVNNSSARYDTTPIVDEGNAAVNYDTTPIVSEDNSDV